ncbi:aminopeptidase P Metallo peptidase. MEROPS family M24B [Nitrosomonas cryotolerans]|uniref:Xaa-Pro aminopeptidase n=1 Tax=Nitrosomonas cryotolerans ATCC 49181 TaxID=1131553 RepID=A0A1N6I1E7_9PROT|nr:Xaa-Pro aminopeptidase [Nitrosomonas cryotolerans]SFP58572.1 aminopeptidase P Metallo peptidase. MEROPS family M24B [Nitrosomonas cryotolerans]SIO25874.1 aminopeptidase P Metallo peptidase. MEROPS family M24B [Nitrosomonas cryotolerans ATCC 49181]
MMQVKSFLLRRQEMASKMQNGVAIIPTASEQLRNQDAHYPYRFDSYFYYLTGFREPESVLVIIAEASQSCSRHILFCRDKDVEREIWNGFRYGPEAAKEIFGFDEAYSISRMDELLPQLIANQPAIYCTLGRNVAWDTRVIGWINRVREQARRGVTVPAEIRDSHLLLDEMRLFKSKEEIQIMRDAAAISTDAHRRAMQITCPEMNEYEIEAELLYTFRRRGAQAPAYTSIVAGGANACVLHYMENNAVLKGGDLLLIDAGCELDGYASDITRTFPINGKFTPVQKDVYQLVLSAQAAAIDAVKPSNSWNDPHISALRVLVQGFIDLGLCQGSVDTVIETEDYKRFYMHGTGHWLGLDVHDVGQYKQGGNWRLLEPGMVLTVEPGCYIRPADNIPEVFWNIGIRIEDDVVVTQVGHELLTIAAPKEIAEIEELMQ